MSLADEEDPIALPPLDADDDEASTEDDPHAIEAPPDDGGDPFDDSEAGDLEGTDDLDDIPEEADDAGEGVDLGGADEAIDAADDDAGDDDDRTLDDSDGDEDAEAPSGDDDGGREGTDDPPEDEVDEGALPDLDADADDDREDELASELLAEAEGALPRWDSARWTQLAGAGALVPCAAVAASGGRVVAAGEVVLTVEEGARAAKRAAMSASASGVALADDLLVLATPRGDVLVSSDDGATATALAGFRGSLSRIALAATTARVWIASEGALYALAARGERMTTVLERGVVAIAASAGVLTAIVRDGDGYAAARVRSDDERFSPIALDGSVLDLLARDAAAISIAEPMLAAGGGGKLVAIGDGERAAVSRDGGASFELLASSSVVSFAFAGEGDDAPLLSIVAPVEQGSTAFLVATTADGEATRIAALGPAALYRAHPAGLAWDGSRDAVWVASKSGLVAFARATKH